MSDTLALAILAAIPATLTAATGIVIAVLNGRKADRAVTQAVATSLEVTKSNEIADQKLNHITVLTNSTLTAANLRIDELERQIQSLLTYPRHSDPSRGRKKEGR